jgi:hypothetical protein
MYSYLNNKSTFYNQPSYYQILKNNISNHNIEDNSNIINKKKENDKSNNINEYTKKVFNISKEGINVLGYNFLLDDIIIIAVVFFLILENKKDYLLLIILGMIILDISFDSFKEINFLDYLFNPS